MEKISGIVPASSRVQGVNLKDSQPLRPGVPTFGRPVGISSLSEGKPLSTAEKANLAHNELMNRRSGDVHKPAIITDMANKFFMKNQISANDSVQDVDFNATIEMGPTVYIEPELERTEPILGLSPQKSLSLEDRVASAKSDVESYEYTPPGTYLDIQA